MPEVKYSFFKLSSKDKKRFWDKVRIGEEDECWEWIAHCFRTGYGYFSLKGDGRGAHRISWMLAHGEIPDKLWVLHECDNPKCVNPNHLFLGTSDDNIKDAAKKGRTAKGPKNGANTHPERRPRGSRHGLFINPEKRVRGEKVHTAKLTEDKVRLVREQYASKIGSLKDLARKFGVSFSTIGRIVNREIWKSVI